METVVGKVIESREKLQKQETDAFFCNLCPEKSITIDLKASSTFSCKIMAKQELHSRQNVDSFCKDCPTVYVSNAEKQEEITSSCFNNPP